MNSDERNLLGETTGPPGSLDGAGVAARMSAPSKDRGSAREAGVAARMSAPSGDRDSAREAGSQREMVGSQEEQSPAKTVVTKFGAFRVTVIVNEMGRYQGIAEIKLTKEYLAHAYKLSARGFLDIEVPEEE